MSLTVAQKTVNAPMGDKFVSTQTVTLDSAYPNPSGYVITAATFGLTRLKRIVNIEASSLPAAATWLYWMVPTYDSDGFMTQVAFHLAVTSTGIEVGNGVNVSTATYVFTVEGN